MKILIYKTILFILLVIGNSVNCISNSIENLGTATKETPHKQTITEVGAEYLIIYYKEPGFTEKLSELVNFRIAQGISTKSVTTIEIGGNTVDKIKSYILEAYTTWEIPPIAIMLVGDYEKIPSPSFQGTEEVKTDISDNYYVDIDGDNLPDITIARLPVDGLFSLTNYLNRIIAYETSPPDYQKYYNQPITSMSWTDNSQIMFNAEVVNGYFTYELNKEPIRENAIFIGTPGNSWFVSPELINYFGPNGLEYVPDTPEYLTDWSGNASGINEGINEGSFIILNLDHGLEQGWSSPEYWISDIQGLVSADPFFVISINNLNGKFNWSFDCFAEGLINHQYGAAGVIASTTNLNESIASEYYFALIDALWDNFMPELNSGNLIYSFTLPAFANTMAKYHIAGSGIPDIESTIYGFHYFGEPYTPIIYNYPDTLNVDHNDFFEEGIQSFDVMANSGSIICLSSKNEILAKAEGTGSPIALPIANLDCEDTLVITVTKQNFIRYSSTALCNNNTGISSNLYTGSFQIFPNPASKYAWLISNEKMEDQLSIQLYDYSGKLVKQKDHISLPYQLEQGVLQSGIYILYLTKDKNLLSSFKVIFK